MAVVLGLTQRSGGGAEVATTKGVIRGGGRRRVCDCTSLKGSPSLLLGHERRCQAVCRFRMGIQFSFPWLVFSAEDDKRPMRRVLRAVIVVVYF